ncbi:hypothetical protein GCM10011609_02350 [Lentzea pudingi]|uniref:LigA protein n=1 Tax=Lentzea pudingi TaxID=1789439 RepID=A0ABQ2HBM1_9PSEU|nr:hypothetical protein [Lentzea pudingi]GGM70184.1 hypothetical protein GCM10011609_02350 [Lentzea pudingi]
MSDETTAAAPPPDSATADAGKPGTEPSDSSPSSGPGGAKEPDRRDLDEAYLRGRGLTTAGAMTFNRDASIQDLQVGDRYIYYNFRSSSAGGDFRAVPVRDEILRWVRSRYVLVAGYDDLLGALEQARVLVLNGRPGTGRFTTGLRLVCALTAGKIFRIDGSDPIKIDEAGIERGSGYVMELSRPQAEALTELDLDALAARFAAKESYLVVICHRDGQNHVLGGFARSCPPPDIYDLVSRHLRDELRDDDCDADEVLEQLYTNRGLREALAADPKPAEAAQIAGFLAEMARGEIDLSQVETRAALLVRRQVEEWFAELSCPADALPEALRLNAFRISLAVFNVSEYDVVVKAGAALATTLLKKMRGEHARKPEESLFAEDHGVNLPASRATMEDGTVSFGGIETPTKLVMFADERFPVVLLSHLWHRHHKLREAVLEWLTELSDDRRPMVWVRAAQTMGLFCSLSFSSTFTDNIGPLAATEGADGEHRRRFAAIALDQAARDERMADAVFERLQEWRRYGSEAQQWTAAAALGYDLGLHRIDKALRELHVLGTPSERRSVLPENGYSDLVHAAARSIANLLAFGAVSSVLARLADWTRSNRQSVRDLARWTVAYLVFWCGHSRNVLVQRAGRDRMGTEDKKRWPLLLTLLEENPQHTCDVSELVRWGLRGRDQGEVVQGLFRQWIHAAEKDDACLDALVAFMPHLIAGHGDLRRLQHLVERMRRDWSDPLDEDIALVLESSILPLTERTAS